ncbi:MAG: heavy metal translocating P-type ATPase [Methylobacterium sp.]|uniref:heavy metal translocating P-type ATPase n=1 Tax=Methylobacterium sp. TaxID=409 RepID=UPI002719F776|nr:heavy metal translocating P-type ATPase [Methylobacterium sp.]MDO9428990.1 heavy metal translocating P-type ATPase [Methylobacterium sp.]
MIPSPASPSRRLDLPVTGLSCASCVGRVERALAALPGASEVAVNLATGRASLHLAGADADAAVAAIVRAGYAVPEATTVVEVGGLSCASCVGRVERALAGVPGVTAASVNLATGRATVRHAEGAVAFENLAEAVRRAGYEPAPVSGGAAPERGERWAAESVTVRRDLVAASVLSAPIVAIDMGGHLVPDLAGVVGGAGFAWVQAALATLVLAGPGRRFFGHGIPALARGRPDMNALVALGAGAAYLYSLVSVFAPDQLPPGTAHLYFEAAVLIVTLILLGRTLEARAKGRTGAAIARLVGLAPATARVIRNGVEVSVAQAELRLGDVVRVRPGERVAADGTVVAGTTYVDESMVTGEAVPVSKGTGATVIGGTLNTTGSIDLALTAVGAETALARIVAMVEAAQGAKLPIQALVDRITAWFVPAVMAASALTFLAWLVLGPSPALGFALVNAIAVLIIACPCAMGLATPTSIMVGTGRAAERGVLFRNGAALQALRDARVVALDKTGTLTEGRPHLTDLHPAPGFSADEVLALAAALEARSEHPIAQAIVAAAEARGLGLGAVTGFEAVPGFGIAGRVGGRAVAVGAARHMARLGIATGDLATGDSAAGDSAAGDLAAGDLATGDLATRAASLDAEGRSPLYVAVDGRLAALLAVADPIKPGAVEAVAALKACGLIVAMVTGDARGTAESVARALGIGAVFAEVLPGGKVEAVRDLRARHGAVAFVGDGINDAPALAEAEVGIAIGTGTDIAVESADVVLMSGALEGLVTALGLSRAVMRNIRQNLFWAFAYNVALIPVAAGALHAFGGPLLSPVLAAGAMALSSVFVLANALRLRRAGGES